LNAAWHGVNRQASGTFIGILDPVNSELTRLPAELLKLPWIPRWYWQNIPEGQVGQLRYAASPRNQSNSTN
jgi:hypothetical protein